MAENDHIVNEAAEKLVIVAFSVFSGMSVKRWWNSCSRLLVKLEPLSVKISSGNPTLEKSSTRTSAVSVLVVILRGNASGNLVP